MDLINIILLLSITVILIILFQKFSPATKNGVKPTAIKKEELIYGYEQRMQKTIDTYHLNNELLKLKKMEILKEISTELSTNIFFDKNEVKELIQKLANMHK